MRYDWHVCFYIFVNGFQFTHLYKVRQLELMYLGLALRFQSTHLYMVRLLDSLLHSDNLKKSSSFIFCLLFQSSHLQEMRLSFSKLIEYLLIRILSFNYSDAFYYIPLIISTFKPSNSCTNIPFNL